MESLPVDVLIPTYNPGAEHLKTALDSLKNQTYPHWKAFIHDESDAADVRAIIAPYLADPRFTFRVSDRRLGIGGNWNACLKATSAPVVAYLFHDDEWHPEYLTRAVDVLLKFPKIGLVSMGHTYRIEGNIVTGDEYRALQQWKETHLKTGPYSGREFLSQWIEQGLRPNIIGEPSFCVLRRSVIDQAGLWNETMPQALDAEYWVRILSLADWYYVAEDSGRFLVHEEGTTAVNRREGRGLFDRFRILQELIDRLPAGLERNAAKRAQVRQFREMAEKYFQKRGRGDTIRFGGGGVLKQFALRHPFVSMGVIVRHWFARA
ncbi:MAG: glycosyltransferase [Candidatus Peregrinibacteria bacterium]